MRTRLSARYTLWIKLPSALLLFVVVFIMAARAGITVFIYNVLNNPGVIGFDLLLFGLCFWLVTFLLNCQKDHRIR